MGSFYFAAISSVLCITVFLCFGRLHNSQLPITPSLLAHAKWYFRYYIVRATHKTNDGRVTNEMLQECGFVRRRGRDPQINRNYLKTSKQHFKLAFSPRLFISVELFLQCNWYTRYFPHKWNTSDRVYFCAFSSANTWMFSSMAHYLYHTVNLTCTQYGSCYTF
jgi:hypothetical protein